MSDQRPTSNRLMLPFVAVCVLCAAEAVAIAFLLGRGSGATPSVSRLTQSAEPATDNPARAREQAPATAPAPASEVAPAPPAAATRTPAQTGAPARSPAPSGALDPAPAPAPPRAPAIARGKVGQRVESAGFAITVVAAWNKPRVDIFALGAMVIIAFIAGLGRRSAIPTPPAPSLPPAAEPAVVSP